MEYLWSLVVGALALYGAAVLINKIPVYRTYKRILAWSRNDAQIKHLAGCANFGEWLATLPVEALHDDIQLAIAASIGANQAPVGYLHNEKSKQPLRELGAKLREQWAPRLVREAERRAKGQAGAV